MSAFVSLGGNGVIEIADSRSASAADGEPRDLVAAHHHEGVSTRRITKANEAALAVWVLMCPAAMRFE